MTVPARLAALASAAMVAASLVSVTSQPAAVAAPADDTLLVATSAGVVRISGDGQGQVTVRDAEANDAAVAPNGDLWVAGDGVVLRYPADGSDPVILSDYTFPQGVAVDSQGTVYVADFFPGRGPFGGAVFVEDGIAATEPVELVDAPDVVNISVDSDDNVLHTRAQNGGGGAVLRATPAGQVTTLLSDWGGDPIDAVEEADGSIIFTQLLDGTVRRLSTAGDVSLVADTDDEGDGGAYGAAIGEDGTIYVTNVYEDTLKAIDPDTGAVTLVSADFPGQPLGVSVGSFEPLPTAQTISLTSDAPTQAVVDGAAYEPAATGGGSDNPVTFSTTTPDTCTYDAETGLVSFVGAGSCTVAADQDGGTVGGVTYADAETVTQTFTVGRGSQVVTFAEDSPTEGSVGESFTPSATGGESGEPVTFSIDEDSAQVCEISDAEPPVVTYTAAGTCVVNADQAGDEDYEAAPTTPLSVAVDVAATTLELVPSEDALTATVTSPEGAGTPVGEVVFTLDDEELGTAELVANPDDPQESVAVLTDADPGTSGLLEATYAGDDATLGGSDDAYDRTAPTLQTTTTTETPLNAAGWYRSPVTIGFVCTEGTAELVGDCPRGFSRANTNPAFHIDRTIVAADGGRAAVDRPLRVDSAAPVLDIRRVGEPVYARTARPIRCSAVDGRSGLDGACEVTYARIVAGPGGGARRVWTATATDVAGNTSSHSGSFRVSGPAPRVAGPGSR